MEGRLVRLERLDPARHAGGLFAAFTAPGSDGLWTYMANGPFEDLSAFRAFLDRSAESGDPFFFTIIDKRTGAPLGLASYLRIQPAHGVIEVGNITYAPALQRRPAATEAMHLMMRRVFGELGYRRYEWKCDALNAPSRRAAQRLGFTYDGLFEQAIVYKGRNRDTAWYSILDRDWPAIDRAMTSWLDPSNFDDGGNQKAPLSAFMPGR